MFKKAKLLLSVLKNQEFKTALSKCSKELKHINLLERKANYELKQAIKKEKASQASLYNQQRQIALITLFTQAKAIYESEHLKQAIKDGEYETVFD